MVRVRRKKAKLNASKSSSRRKAKVAVMIAQSEASASSQVLTGVTAEDGKDAMELSKNEEDVSEVGGYQNIGAAEFSAGEENANDQGLEKGSGVIVIDSENRKDHCKEESINEEDVSEQCFVEDFENIVMEVMNCDAYGNKEGIGKEIEVEPLNMHNEVDKWFVTPNEENEVNVLGELNATAGCLGQGKATVAVGDDVGEINEESTVCEDNCGEYANKDEDKIADDIEKGEEEGEEEYEEVEEEEEEEEEVEEEEEEEEEESFRRDEVDEEEEDLVDDEADEEDMVDDEVDDIHLGEEIHKSVLKKKGNEEDVVGKGNCEGISKEQQLEEGEGMVEAGENNLRNEVEETPAVVEIDGKTADDGHKKDVAGKLNCEVVVKERQEEEVEEGKGMAEAGENNIRNEMEETPAVVDIDEKIADDGHKKDIAGKINCEVVVKERQEEKVEKIKKQKIIRSKKRIRTATIMARSAGKLALKIHDEPNCSHKKKLKQGLGEDLTDRKNGVDDVPNIGNDKNNVAYGNKGKQKVGVYLEDSRGEKVQVNTEKEVGESSKKKRKRLKQKSRSDPVVNGSLVKVASESEGKSRLSTKKNGLLKAETKGMIFMCSSKTKQDCYRYMVLGLPAGKRDLVENIYKGMILFLYDVDKKLLNGIYKAAARGGYDIEPEAFNSKFPAQVRFDILEGCLPLEEEKFSEVIRDNYYTRSKFDCQLNSGQVENLCNLFRASVKGLKSERHRNHLAFKRSCKVRDQERGKAKAKVKEAQAQFVAESQKARPPLVRKGHRHRDRRLVHKEVVSYAYERTLKREAYRGEPSASVAHHGIYREQQLLEPPDTYRREPLLDRRDTYSPDPYLERSGTYRPERMLVPVDMYRVEQSPLQRRDSYRHYPALECRDYNLEQLAEPERRDYDLEPLAQHRDSYRLQGSLLDHQDFYRKYPVLERENRQLGLEHRHSNIRVRQDLLLFRQDHSAYSGGVYSTPAQPLRVSMVPESRAVGLTNVYPSSEAELRYYSHRPVYRL